MTDTKFGQLSSLVLVDTLAALPMQHVVRMARLGHERMRQSCSLKWVTDRMTDVTFGAIVRTRLAGGYVAKTFCTNSIMKKTQGKVGITKIDLRNPHFMKLCVEVTQILPGKLHLRLEAPTIGTIEDYHYDKFVVASRLSYNSQTIKQRERRVHLIATFPEMLVDYFYYTDLNFHSIYYRPALLNGRHVVDVLRAVCGPLDVSEAELDRVRKAATTYARSREHLGKKWTGVWKSVWEGAAVAGQI